MTTVVKAQQQNKTLSFIAIGVGEFFKICLEGNLWLKVERTKAYNFQTKETFLFKENDKVHHCNTQIVWEFA
jgi:hypothetical protein